MARQPDGVWWCISSGSTCNDDHAVHAVLALCDLAHLRLAHRLVRPQRLRRGAQLACRSGPAGRADAAQLHKLAHLLGKQSRLLARAQPSSPMARPSATASSKA